ncbi:hypothetical protein NM208_g3291 [Fusarium decemcellulare]|uniref:Uncharacterized protein n=1 Tax=Fusarium decemcellulare TaxID=57161 RepID=A0ACC1SPQ5_9HYPO|nr:hypothetical protein NM208_g3291 [Fusarium decemcellulare]
MLARGDDLASTSTEYSANAQLIQTNHAKEARARKRRDSRLDRIIYRTRLVIRILSLLFSVSIVAVLGYAVVFYNRSKNEWIKDENTGFQSKVWASHLRVSPTLILLGAAATAALLNLILCVANFSKKVRHLTSVGNVATVVVSTMAIILWVAVGVWYKVDDLNARKHYDMLSYVCARHKSAKLTSKIGNFGALCSQMRYAWWALVVVASLELIAIGTVVWAMWAKRRGGAYSKL